MRAQERPPREPSPIEQRRRRQRSNLLALAVCIGALLIPPPLNFVLLGVMALGSAVISATRREQRPAPAPAPLAPGEVVSLGFSGGREVILSEPELSAHGLILGASGSGKSTTMLKILTAQIARGQPVIAIDLKGSPAFAAELRAAATAAGRPLRVWSPDGPDRWNPLQYGNATELKDKLIATERFTEPHYQRAAERYVQQALTVLQEARPQRTPTLSDVVSVMEPVRLRALAAELTPERAAEVENYLASLGRDQLSAARGLGTRLAIISESHTGAYLEPSGAGAPTVDLRAALNGPDVVLFSLNSSRYGQLAAQLGTLAVQDLISAAGSRLESAPRATATIGIDEFSALGADNVIQLLARGRESGISVLLATQELADLDRAARGLRDQVLGNTALKLVHRQDVPGSARTVAELGGTFKDWEHSFREDGGLLGSSRVRGANSRVVDRYLVEPNTITTLRTGELVRIAKTPEPRTDLVQVWPPTRVWPGSAVRAPTPARSPTQPPSPSPAGSSARAPSQPRQPARSSPGRTSRRARATRSRPREGPER
jgi:conjugal transfer pilus assembly protein TraD